MAYQSLYRRYRSRRFAEVLGQPHVVTALRNSVREGRVGHAYLFSGPRGTGKTSTARILAKVLNCTSPVDGEPCLVCDSCRAIEAGASYDLHELDAASNNGVADVRELIERVAYSTPGRTKVYILDEVHMLSRGAEGALLKTLEEPPAGVVFVLATTEPQKVEATIRSRTQHFEFHLLPAKELEDHVRWIIDDAKLDVPAEAIDHVLRLGGGSARDTLTALEQVAAAGGVDQDDDHVDELIEALAARDTGGVLAAVARATAAGRDPRVLAEAAIGRLRDVFLAAMRAGLEHLPDRDRNQALALADRFERPFITRSLEVLGEAVVEMRQAADPRVTLDVALVRITDVEADNSLAALAERVTRLERALAAGGKQVPELDRPRPPSAPLHTGPLQEAPSTAPPAPGPSSAPPPAPGPSTAPPPAPARTSAPDPTPTATPTTGDLPTRDELTLAWADDVLPKLPGRAKARFGAGRFTEVADGVARFALPNAIHRSRAEEVRVDVERALADHFGRPVPLELVTEGDAEAPAPSRSVTTGTAPAAAVDEDDDEEVDPDELADAPPPARSDLELLTDAFPGAEVIESEP